jgi:hypothetical protein
VDDMEKNIFRKKSLDRIASPEQLTDYIKVSNPSVWIILSAIVVLLISVLIWSIFGILPTTLKVTSYTKNGTFVCYVDSDTSLKMKPGMEIKIHNTSGTVREVSTKPVSMEELGEIYGDTDTAKMLSAGKLSYPVTGDISGISDGIYEMEITIEKTKPISFVLN